jgi:dihydroorotate dehydrogenase (fumarate)
MDLRTSYLGIELESPLMVGSSPLVDDLDTVRRLEDAGAAAIVMHSLFEEQLVGEQVAAELPLDGPAADFLGARDYLPSAEDYALAPDAYYEQLARIKRAVAIPVVASLNGSTLGYWVQAAGYLESAGADAVELNLYRLATDARLSAEEIEREAVEVVRAAHESVRVPIAVKLSPFYTSLAHFATRLSGAGADGLVLFNRFYQPDIDLDTLAVERKLHLSDPTELLLRLRWLAILRGRLNLSLAASGGVHSAADAVKALLAGADVVQIVSLLLREGPASLIRLKSELIDWLGERGHTSLNEVRGSLALDRVADPGAYERANYLRLLQGPTGD